jgi:predicted permease
MPRLGELLRRLAMLARRRRLERDLDEEMRLHLELREAEARERGLSPEEARLAARRRFGSTALAKDESRDAWALRWLDDLARDLRLAWRGMLRTPGFTALAVLAMALGIAANTAVLSVVDGVLLRPLPYADPDRLVVLLHGGTHPVSPANYRDWQAAARSFDGMGAAEAWAPNLAGERRAEQLPALRVSEEIWRLLGVAPLLGRTPAGEAQEIVLGHGLWQRRFGGDPEVLGSAVRLDGDVYTVVGVMPPGFRFAPFWATGSELWAPLPLAARATQRGGSSLRIFARLAPGVALAGARAEVAAITARLEREHPRSNRDVQVVPLLEKVVGETRPALLLLLAAVGFVLLIACTNVAHLLLARAAARQRELTVRAALGAGRSRLVRQLLAESLLLALLGGAAGIALGAAAVDLLGARLPAELPLGGKTVALDGFVLAVMTAVTVAAGVGFGLAPALRATRVDLGAVLHGGARGSSDGAAGGRARDLLLGSQLALAVLLLAGAGLTLRSVGALAAIDPGFDPRQVLSLVVSLSGSETAAPGKRAAFYEQLAARVAALPGVVSSSAVNHIPLGGDLWGLPTRPAGDTTSEPRFAAYRVVMPGYFGTLRIPIVRGRPIDDRDRPGTLPVAVVNERLAAELWPGHDPLGERVLLGDETLTVVGVVGDVRQLRWAEAPGPELYRALVQDRQYLEGAGGHFKYLTYVVRSGLAPDALLPAIRAAVADLDGAVAVADVKTLDEVVSTATARPRFFMWLLGAFAAAALVLAAAGIYGTTSHAVTRRVKEIGIRAALGAPRRALLRLLLGRTLVVALLGAACGVAGALALARLLRGLLYGVSAADPLVFAAVPLLLVGVALFAGWVPARRALRADPMRALRAD